ncbi:serine hydrolase [Patescibacteria group bacterium]|nr:serine hydrolase [Patescibacteria group bacterium]
MDKPITIISILLVLLIGASIGLRYFGEEPVLVSENKNTNETLNTLPEFEIKFVGESSSSGGDSSVSSENEPTIAVAAGAYLLSGEKISGWKTEKHWPIASITKLMTAFVTNLTMEPAEEILITQTAVDTIGESGGLMVGESFQARDLIKAMLIVSSNDSAVALAEHYGSIEFVELMNQAAQEVGMENTRFVEPTGLSSQNQSTIEDLVKFVAYIWKEDRNLFEISRRSTDFIVDMNAGVARQLTSINAFAGRGDFLGGKTGSIPASDGNLVSIFSVPGKAEPIIIVVFGSKDRFGETINILTNL